MKKYFISDIDGVLANFDEAFEKYARSKIEDLPAPNLSQYDFKRRYPGFEAEIDKVWEEFQIDDEFINIKAYPGVQKVSYFEPIIVTARPESAYNSTKQWLTKNGIYFQDLILEYDKKKYANPEEVRGYFEDRPEYVQQFVARGVPTFKRVHPYNAGVTGKNIIPFSSWGAIPVKYILSNFSE